MALTENFQQPLLALAIKIAAITELMALTAQSSKQISLTVNKIVNGPFSSINGVNGLKNCQCCEHLRQHLNTFTSLMQF